MSCKYDKSTHTVGCCVSIVSRAHITLYHSTKIGTWTEIRNVKRFIEISSWVWNKRIFTRLSHMWTPQEWKKWWPILAPKSLETERNKENVSCSHHTFSSHIFQCLMNKKKANNKLLVTHVPKHKGYENTTSKTYRSHYNTYILSLIRNQVHNILNLKLLLILC